MEITSQKLGNPVFPKHLNCAQFYRHSVEKPKQSASEILIHPALAILRDEARRRLSRPGKVE